MEIVGQQETKRVRPWLDGRDHIVTELDAAVAPTKALWTSWVAAGDRTPAQVAEAKALYDQARRVRREALKKWQGGWWNCLAAEAEEAAMTEAPAEAEEAELRAIRACALAARAMIAALGKCSARARSARRPPQPPCAAASPPCGHRDRR